MMAQDYYTVLTNAGLAYEARSKAEKTPINLAYLGVGDGNGEAYRPGPEATALRRETHRQALNALLPDDNNPTWLMAEALLPDDVGGWTIREVGIYTDTGILYAIGRYPESIKPLLPGGATKQFYVKAIFQTSNAANVTLIVDNNTVQATRDFVINHVRAELDKRDAKNSVLVATTQNIELRGLQPVDGEALNEGDRVLVKDQQQGKDNGILIASANDWKRATDADVSSEVTPGLSVAVEKGAVNGDSIWQLVTDAPITLGFSDLRFEVVSSRTGVKAGTYHRVTVDKFGRVLKGSNPTKLADFGIVDAYSKRESNDLFLIRGFSVFATPGVWEFVVPEGVYFTEIEVWGAGGAGGAGAVSASGGGGGAGGYGRGIYAVAPGQEVVVTVGTQGMVIESPSSGGPGGTSSFGRYLTAAGGSGGISNYGGSGGGTGGTVYGDNLGAWQGQSGGSGVYQNSFPSSPNLSHTGGQGGGPAGGRGGVGNGGNNRGNASTAGGMGSGGGGAGCTDGELGTPSHGGPGMVIIKW